MAVPVWEQIAKLRPMDMLPHKRLAGLYKACNDPERPPANWRSWRRWNCRTTFTPRAPGCTGRSADLDKASARALKAVYIDPYNTDAHRLLLDSYEKLGNTTGEARERRIIGELEHWQENATDTDSAHAATQAD